jgi:hypothetical protein
LPVLQKAPGLKTRATANWHREPDARLVAPCAPPVVFSRPGETQKCKITGETPALPKTADLAIKNNVSVSMSWMQREIRSKYRLGTRWPALAVYDLGFFYDLYFDK